MNRKKLTAIRFLLIILTLGVMITIFLLSADGADASNEKSDLLADSFIHTMLANFNLTPEQIDLLLENAVFIVRKTAHFAEYAALGFFIYSVFVSFYVENKIAFPTSFVIGALYAVSDEIHQYFVPGRSCQFSDMLLDWCGVAAGIFVLWVTILIFKKVKEKKKQNKAA